MKSREIVARHYSSRETIRLRWVAGNISHYDIEEEEDTTEWWLAPALWDLQVNGFAGVDFQQDQLSLDAVLTAVRGLRRAGCTRFLLTLCTASWERMLMRLRCLRQMRAADEDLQAAIVGWHLEGPFLSAEPGFCGVHDPSLTIDPQPHHVKQLREATGGDPVLVTLAPERKGALEAIRLMTEAGIRVSLGHTNASAEVLAQAVAAGATGFTHLGNACPQSLDRHDNILWRVFETTGLTATLIPDRIHVSPTLFRLTHRLIAFGNLVYVSDATAAAGAPPGTYTVGDIRVAVGEDQVVRQPGKDHFAGSALRPVDGVFRAAAMVGMPWQEAWRRFSLGAAEFLGMPSHLGVGQPADFCLVRLNQAGELTGLRTFCRGEETE